MKNQAVPLRQATVDESNTLPILASGNAGMLHSSLPIQSNFKSGNFIKTVDGRDLHNFLQVKRDFSTWMRQRIAQYDFRKNLDYFCSPKVGSKGKGGHNSVDYLLSLDMAKELSIVERTPRGKQARIYFIECEKKLVEIALASSRHDWHEQRLHGKFIRLQLTDTIQTFTQYAQEQGSTNYRQYYRIFSKATNRALFHASDGYSAARRDALPTEPLSILMACEKTIERALEEGMREGLPYRQISKNALDGIKTFANLVGQIPAAPPTLPARSFSIKLPLAH